MAQYEKKMMQFEAFQYDGDLKGTDDKYYVPDWAVKAYESGILYYDTHYEIPEWEYGTPGELYTKHPDGEVVHIPVGYYIIRWSDTELYPCEPNLFEASYARTEGELVSKATEIAREYGYVPQSRQLIEEMAELTVAVNKHWRISEKFLKVGQGEKTDTHGELCRAKDRIVDEMGDVQIMLWQMCYLLGVSSGELKEAMDWKIERQLARIRERRMESGGDEK